MKTPDSPSYFNFNEEAFLKKISVLLCVLVIIAMAAFIGLWISSAEDRAFVGEIIKINASICLFFLATALILRKEENSSRFKNWLSLFLVLFVTGFAGITLLEYIFNFNFGIDQIFGTDISSVNFQQFSGRMAPNAALCFLCLALALLMLDGKNWHHRLSQKLTIFALVISLVALIGHIYQATSFYQILMFQKFRPVAAAGAAVLSIAFLLMRPQKSIIRRLSNKTSVGFFARRLLIASILVPPIFGWLGWAAAQYHLMDKTLAFAAVAAGCMFFLVVLVWRSVMAVNQADIRRLKTERNLAVERSRLVGIIDNLPAGVMIQDIATGKIILSNSHIREILKLPLLYQSDILASDLQLEGYHLDGRPLEKDEWPLSQTILNGTTVRNHEMLVRCGDGALRVVSTYCSPIYDDKGQIQAAVLLLFEITARKRNEDWTHFVANTSQLITSTLDNDKTFEEMVCSAVPRLADFCFLDIVDENGIAQRKAWKHADPEIQKSLDTLYRTNPSPTYLVGTMASSIHEGKNIFIQEMNDPEFQKLAYSEEAFHQIKSLNLRSIITVPLGSKNTMMAALSFCMTSFSGRTFEIADYENAKEFSGYLTIALENIILYQQSLKSKQAAENANEAKTRFLANMSHELRTPLGAITGFLELMKSPKISKADLYHYMSVISRNSQQLLRLIDDILDLSKVEAGRMSIENIDFSLSDLIQDLSSIIGFKTREKGVGFNLILENQIPEKISLDPVRLRQVLSNILGNAVKFTSKGQIELSLRYEMPTLTFTIKDTGAGIGPDQAIHLFQPFMQADPSTTRIFGGTGLGLSLSRRLSKLMGGNVFLKSSQVGEGSTFVVTVQAPVSPGSGWMNIEDIGKLDGVETVSRTELPKLKDTQVLVVEDSPDNQVLISTFLKRAGAVVDLASNGLEGVEKALAGNHHIVLMDIQMPKMDGYTAMRLLRSKNFKTPIIALTAHAMKEERDLCFEAGCTAHLPKPVNREHLLEMIAKLVSKERTTQNPSASTRDTAF